MLNTRVKDLWSQISLLAVLIACLLSGCAGQGEADGRERTLRIAVPPSGLLAPPVLKMVHDQPFQNEGIRLEWVAWNNPDQLRVLIVRGEVDLVGMHLTTAALFNQKDVPTRFLGASLGNVLHVLTREPAEGGLHGLQGKSVAVPMRGEYPDMMFRALLDKSGLKDHIRIQYTATSQDAANQLRAGAVDAALVADPHFSILMERARVGGGGIEFFHAVDIQKEWNEANGRTIPMVTAGLAAVGNLASEERLLQSIWSVYQEAVAWCLENPDDAVALLGDALADDIARQGASNAFSTTARPPIASGLERDILKVYLDLFRASLPESHNNRPPGEDFFWYPPPLEMAGR